jgi:hypothetical protein
MPLALRPGHGGRLRLLAARNFYLDRDFKSTSAYSAAREWANKPVSWLASEEAGTANISFI